MAIADFDKLAVELFRRATERRSRRPPSKDLFVIRYSTIENCYGSPVPELARTMEVSVLLISPLALTFIRQFELVMPWPD